MAYSTASPNTGETIGTPNPDLVHLLWQEGCDRHEENADFFKQFEGTGSDSPIQVKNDTAKGAGQEIIFPMISGFYKEAKRGNDGFEETADFEEIKMSSQRLKVDWIRHAARWNERMEEYLGMRGEIVAGIPEAMGDWLGRYKTEQMAMCFREKGNSENYMLPPGVSSVNSLTKNDTLSYEYVVQATSKLKTLNGRPASIGTVGRNKIKKYIIAPLTEALMSLELDPTYLSQLENADVRGDSSYLFQGGFHNLRGHALVEWNTVDHDGDGAVGTPWNPKAYLGAAIAAGTGALTIKGGGLADPDETNTLYFKWFPGWAYKWSDGTAATAGTMGGGVPFYLVIHNNGTESLATGDANKWGMYRVSANNSGATLTTDQRLGSAAGVTRVTTCGNVTWNSDVNTDQHPRGALMFLANQNGLPLFWSGVLGAGCARRGYGKHRNTRGDDSHEAGFISEIFIKSVFGQHLRADRLGRYPGFLLLKHVGQYPGIDTTNATLAS